MLDKNSARVSVEAFLVKKFPNDAPNWVIYDETVDRPYGWVFFFNHRDYVERGVRKAVLAGNSPIFVNRTTGEVEALGTAAPLEFYLKQIEARLGWGWSSAK